MKRILFLCFLVCGVTAVFLHAEDKPEGKRPYIVGTFLTGLGQHLDRNATQGMGTSIEWINGGTVHWSNLEARNHDITVSWPLIFDIKLLSEFGFGFTFGDMLTMSMNTNYQDANHVYFGLSYIHSMKKKKWDIGASLLVFPVYIDDDELIAGKVDVTYWFIKNTGITMTAMFGGTTGWSEVQVFLLSVLAGISLRI